MGGKMGSFLFGDTSLTPLLIEAHPSNQDRYHKAPVEIGCLLVATHVVLYGTNMVPYDRPKAGRQTMSFIYECGYCEP
jgi:hypothetical protein